MSIFKYHLQSGLILKTMVKDKYIISEIYGFFHKNDCNKAINSIMIIIRYFNLCSSCIDIEKQHNFKYWNCYVFPFFMVKTPSNITVLDFEIVLLSKGYVLSFHRTG